MKDSLTEQIQSELGKANGLFDPSMYPQILITSSRHGYGKIMGEFLTNVFVTNKHIDPLIIDGLMTTALYNCENKYCYIIHSSSLLFRGMNHDHIRILVTDLTFPDHITDHEKWTQVCKLLFLSFRERNFTIKNIEIMKSLLTENEFHHLSAIIGFVNFLEFLITVYTKEINYREEPMFIGPEGLLNEDVTKFIKYFDENCQSKIPVFILCSYCKDLKDKVTGTWFNIERIYSTIPSNAGFSHSICDKCYEKQVFIE
ncbi:MAG: hypothetical protein Tsb0034_05110 [Ekhidna sp.]